MAPTRSNEEIGGRSYKDYAYSPVSVSSSSAVLATDTPDRKVANAVELNAVHDKQLCETALRVIATHRPESMMEKGSKLIQFLAAAAGKCPPKGRAALESVPDVFLTFSSLIRVRPWRFFQARVRRQRWTIVQSAGGLIFRSAVRDTRSEFTIGYFVLQELRFVERTLRVAMISPHWNLFPSARLLRVPFKLRRVSLVVSHGI